MTNLPIPVFFETDEAVIIAEMKADYEAQTGKQLAPTQTEQLLVNSYAYREKVFRIAGNEAAKQNLLAFARYPMLDYIGESLGVTRLPAAKALCTIRFTLAIGHPSVFIPAGIRVQTTDGKIVFLTLEDITAATGVNTVDVVAEATTEGITGNGYLPGTVSIILDPQAFVATAANTDTTNAGTDEEGDDALRERIRLAPSSFSTAGPEDAYIFFAKSANPGIIDVAITSPDPGDVFIYPLMAGGAAPSSEVIGQVLAVCNAEKKRPLNDNVQVFAPTQIDYAIAVNLVVLTDAIDDSIIEVVTARLTAYAQARQTKLGIDAVVSQIIGQCMIEGVYECTVITPSADLTIDKSEFANCTGITVNITGQSDA